MNIKSILSTTLISAAALSLTACSSINIEEMEKLDADTARATIAGMTQTMNTDYGKWAEYFSEEDLSGAGKAWGDWGAEQARATTTISDSGNICTQYQGEYDWATDAHKFCFEMYQDAEGNYFLKVTENTFKPERVGKVRSATLVEGDKYNLMQ